MNYQNLTTLFRRMLNSKIPTSQALNGNYTSSLDFWGNDSQAWIITEGFPTIEMRSDESSGPSFSLVDDGITAYDEFINQLNTDQRIVQAIDIKAIEKLLEKLLRRYNQEPDTEDSEIRISIQEAIKELKDSICEWTAIAPVDYLIFQNMIEISVGKVNFKLGAEIVEYSLREFHQRIEANASSDEDKEAQKTLINTYIPPLFNENTVVATVSVEGESSKVKYLAEEEIETSLNLLRCYTHVLFHPGFRVKMGLRHTTGYYMRPSIGFSTTDYSWNFSTDNVGLNKNYDLSNENIALLKQYYAFDELSGIIGKKATQRSKLEKLLVTVINWLGRGVAGDDKANKILHYAAASETLIMGQISEGEITEKFSRRLAFLIGRNSEQRVNIYARAKSLYNKRSKVIHAGSTSIEESDVLDLEFLTLRALVEMAKKTPEWRNHDDFINWFQSVSL